MSNGRFWAPRAFIAVVMVVAAAGCGSVGGPEVHQVAGSEMSRVRLYSSVAELAADSRLVIEGTVTGQSVAADVDAMTDFTLSEVKVVRSMRGADRVVAGDSVVVRQLGSDKQHPPVPILVSGHVYLLYLTPSGLEGSLSSQYYVTGANAGIYVEQPTGQAKNGAAKTFAQVQRQPGETLPSDLSDTQAVG